jgi:mono/diheme cytochrome c family protein
LNYKRSTFAVLIFCLVLVSACTDTATPQPTLDISQVRSLKPTVSPDDVEALAQLADKETLQWGEGIYVQSCAECHGIDGEGQFPDDPMKPDETGRFGAPPHNGNGHTWHHDDDLILKTINGGGMGSADTFYPMPAFGDTLSQEDIGAVLAYIKSFWTEEQRMIQAERTLQIANQ